MITKEQFAAMQDHSILEPYATENAIRKRCEETIQYGFSAVYVNPCWVSFAKQIIGDKAKVGTVVGFPHGANTTKIKIAEALEEIDNGADDLDLVINISKLKSKDYDYVENELKQFVKAVKDKKPSVLVKIIIETCYLNHDEKVKACEIVARSGADYIKTSTGCGPAGCKVSDIRIMKRIVGDKMKIKGADRISSVEDALSIIEEGASLLGESHAIQWLADWDKQLWSKDYKR